jgi:putative nucleotidyltransferase with HDIG domain
MLDYTQLVRAAEGLDPVPVSVSRLVGIVARDHWAFSEVEQVVSLDQALTGRLLQVANSAASAALVPIGTVKDAIIRVGVGPVLSFAMACCIGPQFKRALPEYGLSEGELWQHSVAASLAAEIVMAMAPNPVPAEAVTAALLHDVGKLVLARFLSPDVLAGLAEARAHGDRSAMQAEVDVLGVHHGQLGGLICRNWNLPDRLAEAVAHHHTPDRANDVLCDTVHLANIASRLVTGKPEQQRPVDITPTAGAIQRLGLTGGFLDRLCNHVTRRLEEVMARYSIATQPISIGR